MGIPELVDIFAIEQPETGRVGVSDVSIRDDANQFILPDDGKLIDAVFSEAFSGMT
jgi:hypothetical protein